MTPEHFRLWLEAQTQTSTTFARPLIMGVLNVTPDSFSDGAQFLSKDKACEQALRLSAQGADLIDIGGESSKPGAIEVAAEEELNRVVPVIEQIRRQTDICISIDTYKPEVMEAAIGAGANLINDIYALQKDGALKMAAKLAVPVCLMHMQGNPRSMQQNPQYPEGIMEGLKQFFAQRLDAAEQAGLDPKYLILDPGFGFGKLVTHNLQLVHHLEALKYFNRPLLLGLSRKSTIGAVLDKKVSERLIGSLSLSLYAVFKGVNILRTHDVAETAEALKMIQAVREAGF